MKVNFLQGLPRVQWQIHTVLQAAPKAVQQWPTKTPKPLFFHNVKALPSS